MVVLTLWEPHDFLLLRTDKLSDVEVSGQMFTGPLSPRMGVLIVQVPHRFLLLLNR